MRTKSDAVQSDLTRQFPRRCLLTLCMFAFAIFVGAQYSESCKAASLVQNGRSIPSVMDVRSVSRLSSLHSNFDRFAKVNLLSVTVLFADAIVAAASVPLEGTNADKTFWQRIKRSFEKTFIVDGRWRLFRDGIYVTLSITILSLILGTFFAFIQCCMRRSQHRWLRYPAKIYISIMQGTPILVILLIMYYVVFKNFKTPWGFEKETVAIIAMALNFAAYAGEMMRTGVDGIDNGLIEAARALGFGRLQVFTKVILPIATRRIIPVYKGESISLLKSTSIVGYIATQDLTKVSDIVRARTYEAFFPLIATAIIYLFFALCLTFVFMCLEQYLDPLNRRKRAKGEVNV